MDLLPGSVNSNGAQLALHRNSIVLYLTQVRPLALIIAWIEQHSHIKTDRNNNEDGMERNGGQRPIVPLRGEPRYVLVRSSMCFNL